MNFTSRQCLFWFVILSYAQLYSGTTNPCRALRADGMLFSGEKYKVLIFNGDSIWNYDIRLRKIIHVTQTTQYFPGVETPLDSVTEVIIANRSMHAFFTKKKKTWLFQRTSTNHFKIAYTGNITKEGFCENKVEMLNFEPFMPKKRIKENNFTLHMCCKGDTYTCEIENILEIDTNECGTEQDLFLPKQYYSGSCPVEARVDTLKNCTWKDCGQRAVISDEYFYLINGSHYEFRRTLREIYGCERKPSTPLLLILLVSASVMLIISLTIGITSTPDVAETTKETSTKTGSSQPKSRPPST